MTTTPINNSEALTKTPSFSKVNHDKYTTTTKPIGLMVLDLIGFVLIVIGLKQQFGNVEELQPSLLTAYSGMGLIIVGLIMTLPFIAWSLKSCIRVMSKISI
jgi:hypothetical protein